MMTLRQRSRDQRLMLRLGMFFLLLYFAAARFLHATTDLGQSCLDGGRGALLGLAIGLNLWSVRLARGSSCGA